MRCDIFTAVEVQVVVCFVRLGGHVGIPVLWRNLLPLSLGEKFFHFL